jgi:hypothetical protein
MNANAAATVHQTGNTSGKDLRKITARKIAEESRVVTLVLGFHDAGLTKRRKGR